MAGAQSDVATLRRVVVRHARDAFHSDTAIDRQWRDLNYLARPDFARAVAEYDGFVELLRDGGAAVHALPADGTVGLDSIYVGDAAIACDRGEDFGVFEIEYGLLEERAPLFHIGYGRTRPSRSGGKSGDDPRPRRSL